MARFSLFISPNPEPAIDIFKQLHKEDPSNEGAKQNLELALSLLKQQQQQQQEQQQNQDENTQPRLRHLAMTRLKNPKINRMTIKMLTLKIHRLRWNKKSGMLLMLTNRNRRAKQHAHDILDTLSQREEGAKKIP